MNVLSTRDLHKQYGRITAVHKLNLNIAEGTVFGLLGPNGSGKTTTLGMILGVTRPTSGEFLWFGERAHHSQRKQVGAILEKPNFYPTFSAYKNLQLACKIKDVGEYRIAEVLEQVDLAERQHDPFRTYSLGMKQRLAIASALLADPRVLILDEPTNGLDPKGIAEIRQLIIDIAETGKTIILASHLLDEVQKVCSEFAILRRGKLIHNGRVDANFGREAIIQVGSENIPLLERVITEFPGYISHLKLKDTLEVKCETGTRASDVNAFLFNASITATHISTIKKNLEKQFMEIVSNHE